MTNFSGTIVTLGGGGFSQAGAVTPIDDHILHLTRVERPRICFVPTASGDDLGYAEKYRRWVADSALPDGHAADDGVALVWSCDTEYGTFTDAVTEKPGGVAWRVTREQDEPHVIPTRLLGSPVAPRISEILHAANLLGLAGRTPHQ